MQFFCCFLFTHFVKKGCHRCGVNARRLVFGPPAAFDARRLEEEARRAEDMYRAQQETFRAQQEAQQREAFRAQQEAQQREALRAQQEAQQREAFRAQQEAQQREALRAQQEAQQQEALRAQQEEARRATEELAGRLEVARLRATTASFSHNADSRSGDTSTSMDGVYEYPPAAMMTAEERARHRVAKRDRDSANTTGESGGNNNSTVGQVPVEQDSFVLMEGDTSVWEHLDNSNGASQVNHFPNVDGSKISDEGDMDGNGDLDGNSGMDGNGGMDGNDSNDTTL